MTTPPNSDITEPVTDDEFGARFLAYVGERVAYHTQELAKLTELRRLWNERQPKQERPHGNAG